MSIVDAVCEYLEETGRSEAAKELREEFERLREALSWYDLHKREDGSYDGELFGDLFALGDAPQRRGL